VFIKNRLTRTKGDTILWRYLSFSKLLDLLETSSLYFRRIDCFDDQLEATQPKSSAAFATVTENPWQVFSYQCTEKQLEIIRNLTYACCWHINENESSEMWQEYATKHGNEGVAIQTTFRDISECFQTERLLKNIRMKYIDYSTEFRDYSYPDYGEYLSIKDKRYEHENELRIITLEHDYPEFNPDIMSVSSKPEFTDEEGIHIKVDLNRLIQKLYLCPASTKRFSACTCELLNRYGVKAQVVPSTVNSFGKI